MKLNRLELIAQVEALIAKRKDRAVTGYETALEEHIRAQGEYVDRTAEDWDKLVRNVRAMLRSRQPVTRAVVPAGLADFRGHGVRFFDTTPPTRRQYAEHTAGLEATLSVLKASSDDYVTDAALARMGAPIREILRGW